MRSAMVSWLWVVIALVGCRLFENHAPGGDGDLIDGRPIGNPDAPEPFDACNPLAPPGQQGCPASLKCTWIAVQDVPTPIGKLGCVPDGPVAPGGACVQGPIGESTGFDNCAAGNVCIDGRCDDVCGFGLGAGCAPGFACTRFDDLFANPGDEPFAGACVAACDPLTGVITGGGACPTGQGCYVVVGASDSVAVCAEAGTVGHGELIDGPVFANSCRPGHLPRRTAPGATSFECGALCKPADVTSTTNMSDEGGVAPFTCAAAGAAPPDSPTAGESCRFLWARESFSTLSSFSNSLGFCWRHATWTYDSDSDQLPDARWPRCTTLTHGDVVPPISTPPHDDALFFWCTRVTATFATPTMVVPTMPATPHVDRASRFDRMKGTR